MKGLREAMESAGGAAPGGTILEDLERLVGLSPERVVQELGPIIDAALALAASNEEAAETFLVNFGGTLLTLGARLYRENN